MGLRLETIPRYKSITWVAHTYCNYKCSYCIPALNAGYDRWKSDYSKIIQIAKKFREDLPLKFDIMGGEPTLWPQFEQFCNDLNATGDNTFITFSTNASRTLRYWQDWKANVSEVVISYHPEFADHRHIEKVINILAEKGYNIVLYLMCPPEYFEKVKEIHQYFLEKNLPCIMWMKVVSDWTGSGKVLSAYNKKQLTYISNSKHIGKYDKIWDESTRLFGREIDTRKLISEKKNNFKGWLCAAGIDYIGIEANGDIYGSECKAFGKIGNINTGYKLAKKMQICPRDWCNCGTDLRITKKLKKKKR